MKFLCVQCDAAMELVEKNDPQDGTLALQFKCPSCAQRVAMLTNPGETQFVRSLGVQIGHEHIAAGPMSIVRGGLTDARPGAFTESSAEPVWTEAALRRLSSAPTFVQPIVRKLYSDFARSKSYAEITPAVMNEARDALGMTGM
ncbi:MAG: PCP reductase family protein [Chloroflexi bacterium]|nr:PCP reductase family protein [Chloroflexota bacterium]